MDPSLLREQLIELTDILIAAANNEGLSSQQYLDALGIKLISSGIQILSWHPEKILSIVEGDLGQKHPNFKVDNLACKISTLPEEFQSVRSQHPDFKVDNSSCEISTLPEEFQSVRSQHPDFKVDNSSCEISTLPEEFQSVRSQDLDFKVDYSSCKISTLPEEFQSVCSQDDEDLVYFSDEEQLSSNSNHLPSKKLADSKQQDMSEDKSKFNISVANQEWTVLEKKFEEFWMREKITFDSLENLFSQYNSFLMTYGAKAYHLSSEWSRDLWDWEDEMIVVKKFRKNRIAIRARAAKILDQKLLELSDAKAKLCELERELEYLDPTLQEEISKAEAKKSRLFLKIQDMESQCKRLQSITPVNTNNSCVICEFPGVKRPDHCPRKSTASHKLQG